MLVRCVDRGQTMIVSVKLEESVIRKIDTVVSSGKFRSRSDFIRKAIERKIKSLRHAVSG